MYKSLPLVTVLFISNIIYSSPVFAEMYKWIDEDGNTQYTQSPPPDGREAETLKPPPKVNSESAVKKLKEQQDSLDEIRTKRKEAAEAELKEQEKMALKEENCKNAKAKLQNNLNTGRIRAVDEEGNVVRATEEERQRRIKSAQEAIDKWCN